MKIIKNLTIAFLLLVHCVLFSQESVYSGNPSHSFDTAKTLAFKGERKQARDTLLAILSKYPKHTDAQNLLAKTYSWDGNYNKARKVFNKITSNNKQIKEVWVAAIKNEIYATNYTTALGLANKALLYNEGAISISNLKVQILEHLNKPPPRDSLNNAIRVSMAIDVFSKVYDPMYYGSISYKRETKYGSIIPKINYNNRFGENGIQYEIDAYPKFSKKLYGYLNFGYSSSKIFPKNRVGAELYATLPKTTEASLGMRYLNFNNGTATIFTGSYSLYRGDYYFSLRPYISPRKNKSISISGAFTIRKYLKDSDTYLGANIGMGYTPELKQLIANDILLSETLLFIESQHINFVYQFSTRMKNVYKTNLGVIRQELLFIPGEFFFAISVGVSYKFKF
ncbi:MAG: YaiO family outer membrane beta-barrel protein [Cellulophaga sp.]